MAHNNGRITSPISLHGDVYPVLAIAPSGAYYDVAEACTSGKINKWSLYKPYVLANDTPQELVLEIKDMIGADGQFVGRCYVDPSKSTSDDAERDERDLVFWGVRPNGLWQHNVAVVEQTGNKEIKRWIFEAASSFKWELQVPKGNYFKRLTDFDGYNHVSKAPIIIEPSQEIKNLIDFNTGLPKDSINLFPNGNKLIRFHCHNNANSDFSSTYEFFQRDSELRFTIEMWPQYSGNGNWLDCVYPTELLGKWFSRAIEYDQEPTFQMNIQDHLDYLIGVDDYWHIGKDGLTVNYVLALSKANGDLSKEIFYAPNNMSIPDSTNSLIATRTDPSVADSALPSPLYVGFSGSIGFHWPVRFGCWFNRNLYNIKWGYNINYSPYIAFRGSDLPTSEQGQKVRANTSTLFIQLEMERLEGEFFSIKSADRTFNGNSVKFGAYCTNSSGSATPIIAEVITAPSLTNGEWNGNGTTTNVDAIYTGGTDRLKLYLRFPNFWVKPYSGQGCKIRLMASLADEPNNVTGGSVLDNWFDISTLCTMADGSIITDNDIETDVYYEE